jgi:hypothetical protein
MLLEKSQNRLKNATIETKTKKLKKYWISFVRNLKNIESPLSGIKKYWISFVRN